jgi:hypothetical protein
VNRDEAKTILLLYRRTADAEDPQIAEALALAKHDPELAAWLDAYSARQFVIGEKLRQISVPAGLKEQIISEQAASDRMISTRGKIQFAAAAAILLLFGALAVFWLPPRVQEDTLAIYQNQMAGVALRGYTMDVLTNDPVAIRTYLAQQHAPADFVLPAPLQRAVLTGCAVREWQGVKVAMICFRTGKPLASGTASDLWLFVVDRSSVKNAPDGGGPQLAQVNRLITATWIQDNKLYLLGIEGGEPAIKSFL